MAKKSKLGPRTFDILNQLSEQIIPSGDETYPGTKEIDLPSIIIDRFGNIPVGLPALKTVIWWWELSPFINSLAFKRFSKMSSEQQIRYMEGWECSRFYIKRMAFIGIKALFMIYFYNDPIIWEKIGYKEECLAAAEEEMLHENN